MAAASPNGGEATDLNGTRKIPPEIIIPPKVIRDNAEKTADYIVRKGAQGLAFEQRLIAKIPEQPKFSFLLEQDPYYAYYKWFYDECSAGRGLSGSRAEAAQAPEKPKGPVAPPNFKFSAKMPSINSKDLEVLKLTALYTAKNGDSWKRALAQREAGNYQFDFLRATHSYHTFFAQLVEQYKTLLDYEDTKKARVEELRRNVEDRFHILDRARQRAEYTKYQEQQRQQEQKRIEDEKREYAEIDWHDFIIVGTIVFTEADDQTELALPMSLNNLQSASLETKALMSLAPADRRIDEAAPDEETYYVVGQQNAPTPASAPVQPAHVPQPHPVYSPQPNPTVAEAYRTPAQKAHDDDEERRIREREAERDRAKQTMASAKGVGPMRIRENYVPRAAAAKKQVAMGICANCKQAIPLDEMEEHVRIELLDPRWKEQRAKSDSRYSSTNLTTAEVASNLKRLASQRDDVFDGVTGLPISEEELARRKKAATNYDGQPDPAKDALRVQQMQTMNVEEQLRNIKQKFAS